MAVRNFYIRAQVDGRKTDLSGGPAAKDGGMYITITQRNHGGIEKAVTISCFEEAGKLFTYVRINGEVVGAYSTDR